MRAAFEWMDEGLCRDPSIPTGMFFPDTGIKALDEDTEHDAKKVCGACPVRPVCREWALNNNEYGVWGGTTERERYNIRRQRRRGGWQRLPDYETVRVRGTRKDQNHPSAA